MAKKNQESNQTDPGGRPSMGRTFKPDTSQFVTIAIGEQVEGVFIGARTQTITDKRTRQPKDLWVIRLRNDADEVLKIPCAALMLQAWSDIVDEYGDGDTETAIQALRGKVVQITRGDDTKTKGGTRMGTYEFTIFD